MWAGWLIAGLDASSRTPGLKDSLFDLFERGELGNASCDEDNLAASFVDAFPKLEKFRGSPELTLTLAEALSSPIDQGLLIVGRRIAQIQLSARAPSPNLSLNEMKNALAAVARALERTGCVHEPALWVVFDPGEG